MHRSYCNCLVCLMKLSVYQKKEEKKEYFSFGSHATFFPFLFLFYTPLASTPIYFSLSSQLSTSSLNTHPHPQPFKRSQRHKNTTPGLHWSSAVHLGRHTYSLTILHSPTTKGQHHNESTLRHQHSSSGITFRPQHINTYTNTKTAPNLL